MHRLLMMLCLLTASYGIISAQENARYTCPTLDVVGPSGPLKQGDTAKFTAKIVIHDGAELQFKYNWHVSYGKILSGQGTAAIEVERPPSSTIVAIVNIAGTPDDSHCPLSTSEIANWDAPAEAEKILLTRGTSLGTGWDEIGKVVIQLSLFPKDHFYVFLGHRPNALEEELSRREAAVRDRLSSGSEKYAISIVRVNSEDFAEFWRIPPGAPSPTCNECAVAACPEITVTGPAGRISPGDTMIFSANQPLNGFEKLKYNWTVSAGTILEGQGKPSITVQTNRELNRTKLIATVEVMGIAADCAPKGFGFAWIGIAGHPIDLGQITRASTPKIRRELDEIVRELSKHSWVKLYFVLYKVKGENRTSVAKRESFITTYLVSMHKIHSSKIFFLQGGVGKAYARVYAEPAGTF